MRPGISTQVSPAPSARTLTAPEPHALLDSIADGLLAVNADERVTYVNAPIERILGRDRADLLGRNVWDVFPEAVGTIFGTEYQRVMRERVPATFEAQYPPLDIWVEARMYPAPDATVTILFRDITESKRLLAEATNATAELREVQAITDAALSYLHLEELLHQLLGRLKAALHVNAAAILLMEDDGQTLRVRAACGLKEEDLAQVSVPLGEGFAGRIAAARQPLIVDDMSACDAVSPDLQERLRSALGAPLLVDDRMLGVVLVGTSYPRQFSPHETDLLQRAAQRMAQAIDRAQLYADVRAARDEAAQRAQLLEALFDTMTDGIAVVDRAGRTLQQNPALQRMLGLDATRTTYPRPLDEHVEAHQPRDHEGQPLAREQWPVTRILAGEVLAGENVAIVRVRSLTGYERVLSVTGAPLRDSAGEIVAALAVTRDVTEQTHQEIERRQMFGIVSHELKTPLTSMKTVAQVMSRRLERGATLESRHVRQIEQGVDRMNRLVNDLIDVARVENDRLQLEIGRCSLNTLCEEASEEQMAATGRTVTLDMPQESVEVRADTTRTTQVLGNLLSNALKYSPATAPVTLSLRVEGTVARVEVRDAGPGIALEAQTRLFERFYRAPGIEVQHGAGIGLGLGLYICRKLIERQGGTIGVESTPGAGATFWFTLPLAHAS